MTILSQLPDGFGFHYGFYRDDHRQINVRQEGPQRGWIAYVGGEAIYGVYSGKQAAEDAAIAHVVKTSSDDEEFSWWHVVWPSLLGIVILLLLIWKDLEF